MTIGAVLSIHHFQLGCGPGLVDGPRLDRAGRQDTEDDTTNCVDSSSDEEHNLP